MPPEFIDWLLETPVADWVTSGRTVWATMESLHFLSLCFLFGAILVVDLRLLGYYRSLSARTANSLVRIALAAFAVNAITGILFFVGNAPKYVGNGAFELKMLLLVVAGFNALLFEWKLKETLKSDRATALGRAVGATSLAIWVSVIVLGRMITFYA
jgi:hypothetical protein